MTQHSIAHGTFVVEREFPAPPDQVFSAWADPAVKAKWFGSPNPGNPNDVFEFRVGGREYNASKVGEQEYAFEARYYDIVPNQRIVYAYEMHMDGQRISVSVATVELTPRGSGTRLVVTEHGAFLDGLDYVDQRHRGTEFLVDQVLAMFTPKAG